MKNLMMTVLLIAAIFTFGVVVMMQVPRKNTSFAPVETTKETILSVASFSEYKSGLIRTV